MQGTLDATTNLDIVLILTIGSALATVFGYLTEKIRLSPILGYLLAGYFIGPYFPGFVADSHLSEQLAEIGVILMMFWVGMHIKWQELLQVKAIAFTGAIAQTLCSTAIGALAVRSIGWSWPAAIVIGLSIGIASTVVLVRVLADNELQHTKAGYIALSWLIFEDFLAVLALLLLPTLSQTNSGDAMWQDALLSLGLVLVKFALWVSVLFTIGRWLISFSLNKIESAKTRELFTLAVLAATFSITVGSYIITGTSIALGAFVAGMLLGQTTLNRQISLTLMPMRDAFVVFFFLSIGMLFNPIAVFTHFTLFLGILAVILIVKPLVAWIILRIWRSDAKVSWTVALALAQIGEFSFILIEEAAKFKILPDEGYDIIIACAFISLAINPLLIRMVKVLWRPIDA
jgi:CPA2 family monovalent cation:H+ antiporter-2